MCVRLYCKTDGLDTILGRYSEARKFLKKCVGRSSDQATALDDNVRSLTETVQILDLLKYRKCAQIRNLGR